MEHPEAVLPLDPASFAPAMLCAGDQDSVASLLDRLNLLTPLIPSAHPFTEDRDQLLASVADSTIDSVAGVDYDGGIEVAQRGVCVTAAEGVVHLPDDLHV